MEAMGAGGSSALHGGQQVDEEEACRNGAGAVTVVSREYQRGNWTVPETMVLIEAKRKVHSERRQPGEQGLARWRWVEDYCWRAGCRRSQNQCNDRWDNLMRDYKKVRAYELAGAGAPSYWAMCRAERKEKGLPSNLLREIYDAMTEVLERRASIGCSGAGGAFVGASSGSGLHDVPMQASPLAQVLPPALHHLDPAGTYGHGVPRCSSDSESPERKRRRPSSLPPARSSTPPASGMHWHLQQEHGTPPASGTRSFHHHQEERGRRRGEDDRSDGGSSDDDAGSGEEEEEEEDAVLSGAIGRCAAILSDALESREAAEERRHREVMAVEERRGRALHARREAGEQCVAGLANAVNQLAGSMLALAAAKRNDATGGHGPGPGPGAPK
ncbi:hypothetical protein EJB05_05281, partial [Eragrostis curvula]